MGQAQDYEGLIRELLAGVENGWSDNTVVGWLVEKNLKDWNLAQWLKENGALLRADINKREQLVCLAGLGKGELAKVAVEMLQEWKGEDCFNRGNDLCELGRYKEAITSYQCAININTDNYKARFNLGYAQGMLGQYKDSIYSFNHIVKTHPDDHTAWYCLGVSLREVGKYDEAIPKTTASSKTSQMDQGMGYPVS